ncbi:nitrile hydratase accessory protein [Cognatishimia maritima]|uniref:Nitrile hydratase accessory protein n=1 Tax=Cognatishimia maritima TaxID=870908 RepID=A0A1M5TYX6_9RHOB|nr:nitrile hydratase accessory protein [Cognatishimia maritima]SHH55992.1 nitrile hydratase accessory protein [Cognatishimia maritima]
MTQSNTKRPEPRFEQPWHADVFALTVHLNEAGQFTWSEWTETFGATLAAHRLDGALDGGNDYFLAWIDALETLLVSKGLATGLDLQALKDAWTTAYQNTPHGQPVKLGT